jgi:hypothetical protein
MEVREIPYEQAVPWFIKKHYAKRIPSVSWAFGLYINDVLEGVVSYGTPASPSLVKGVCGKENADKVVELNRLVLNEKLPNINIKIWKKKNGRTFPLIKE